MTVIFVVHVAWRAISFVLGSRWPSRHAAAGPAGGGPSATIIPDNNINRSGGHGEASLRNYKFKLGVSFGNGRAGAAGRRTLATALHVWGRIRESQASETKDQ